MLRNRLMKLIVLFTLGGIIASNTISMPAMASQNNDQSTDSTRTGAWVDSVTFSMQDDATTAISQLQSDQLDIYAYDVTDPELFNTVNSDPNLAYSSSFGSYTELTFNPSGPQFYDGRLNPFSNAKIREAMNKLIDREYISQMIYDGLAKPKYAPLQIAGADYTRYLNEARSLEDQYAYDLYQAWGAINNEMLAMGATLGSDNRWQYNGSPVTIIFIIRVEDERTAIGDYVSDQLESIGFTVDRQYKTRQEASPIWNQSNPADGMWHIYTGGWINTSISRDDASNFGYFYTPLGSGSPLWQAYTPSVEFFTVAEKLWNNTFSSMSERDQLFVSALELSMEDSARVWLVEETPFTPRRADIAVASDVVVGSSTQVWPYALKIGEQEGGNVRIAQPGLLVEPWNPVAGSNWIYDQLPIYATHDYDLMTDPTTGLAWPQRIEKAELLVQEGLPVSSTYDWIELAFTPAITVPSDAWVDWDATNQRFITAAEKYTQTVTANIKSTVYYPADLFETVKWHDGSSLDLSDFIMKMILTFDRGKPESSIYDETYSWYLESFMATFKGVRIISQDPLIIDTYHDDHWIDAELNLKSWWPNMSYGPAAWHTLALGVRAEAAQQLAFSADKADQLGIEWMNFIAEPSLSILKNYLDTSLIENYIPYNPTMGAYVTIDEATNRWANLFAWYNARGHIWLGTGPFYLENADYTQSVLTLTRFADYPDPAGKWDFFIENSILDINYTTGAPGSTLNLTGDNFPPNQDANIFVNGLSLGTTPVSDSGTFTFTLTTSNAAEGFYYATASVNPSATVKFIIDVDEDIRPPEGDYPAFDLPAGIAYIYEMYLSLLSK